MIREIITQHWSHGFEVHDLKGNLSVLHKANCRALLHLENTLEAEYMQRVELSLCLSFCLFPGSHVNRYVEPKGNWEKIPFLLITSLSLVEGPAAFLSGSKVSCRQGRWAVARIGRNQPYTAAKINHLRPSHNYSECLKIPIGSV